jgi:hypothetical protein
LLQAYLIIITLQEYLVIIMHAVTSAYVNPARVLSATVVDLMDHEDRNGTDHRHDLLV